MTETSKIAWACFVGGVVGTASAVAATPGYWWLGLFAGAAGGYVVYEFQQTIRAATRVCLVGWQEIKQVTRSTIAPARWWRTVIVTGRWIIKPHPFLYPSLVVGFWCFGKFLEVLKNDWSPTVVGELEIVLLCAVILSAVAGLILAICLYEITEWFAEELPEKEHRALLATYQSWLGFLLIKMVMCLFMLVCLVVAIPINLVLGIIIYSYCFIRIVTRAAWRFVVIIHSNERLICLIASALGTLGSYLFLIQPGQSLSARTLQVLFGGILGAFVGILQYKLISLKLLPRFGILPPVAS
ncbi:MAG: hypothetical protein AAB505_00160 [Patescibacteria group bacterium]